MPRSIELAAQLFSTQGYLQTSIRDIARDANLTTGAIYGHFRNKAELLAEAISSRTATELEASALFGIGGSHVETLREISRRYPERRELRALILQGAAAALTDDETRERLRDEQLAHLDDWAARYEEHRDALGIDPSVDVRDALLYTWAAEVGLGVRRGAGHRAPLEEELGRHGRPLRSVDDAPAGGAEAGDEEALPLHRLTRRPSPGAPPPAATTPTPYLGIWLQGRSLSTRTSPGSPSMRSPRMLRMISEVPPSMVLARERRKRPVRVRMASLLRVIG